MNDDFEETNVEETSSDTSFKAHLSHRSHRSHRSDRPYLSTDTLSQTIDFTENILEEPNDKMTNRASMKSTSLKGATSKRLSAAAFAELASAQDSSTRFYLDVPTNENKYLDNNFSKTNNNDSNNNMDQHKSYRSSTNMKSSHTGTVASESTSSDTHSRAKEDTPALPYSAIVDDKESDEISSLSIQSTQILPYSTGRPTIYSVTLNSTMLPSKGREFVALTGPRTPPMYTGYLFKQRKSSVFSSWKYRYIVLYQGVLKYFTSAQDTYPFGKDLKGEIQLAGYSAVITYDGLILLTSEASKDILFSNNKSGSCSSRSSLSINSRPSNIRPSTLRRGMNSWLGWIQDHISYADLIHDEYNDQIILLNPKRFKGISNLPIGSRLSTDSEYGNSFS
jgi:hypothetical protein